MESHLLQQLFKVSALGILFFVLVFCEDSSLDSVSTTSFQPPSAPTDSNRNTCNTFIWSQHLCNQGLLYPRVKTFLLDENQGICLTREKENQFSASRSQVMSNNNTMTMNFTDCAVSGDIQNYTNVSSSSCGFLRRLSDSLKIRQDLAFAVLNCSRLLKIESHCLVLVPSTTPRNLTTTEIVKVYCSKRNLSHVLSSAQPTQPTLWHSTTVESSREVPEPPSDSVIGFIKNNPYGFGGIVAGFVVVVIVIIALVRRCCFSGKKKRVSALQGHPLAPCDMKESTDGPVYHEPDIHTSQCRNRPEVATRGYDYTYQHHVRGRYRRDLCDITDVKATDSDYDDKWSVREEIGKCEQCPPLKRSGSGTENEEGHGPLPSSQPPPVKPKPVHYVKVF